MISTSPMTANELLMSCPDDQIVRMQNVWKSVAAGDWQNASHFLRHAALDGDSSWHERCAELAKEYENK